MTGAGLGAVAKLPLIGTANAALGAIVAAANAASVAIEQLDLRRPNLEDAFIAITGESLEDEDATSAA